MKLRSLTLCALALVGLMACNDSDNAADKGAESGYLTFSVATTDNVDNITTRADKILISSAAGSGYTAPAAADFTITITNEDEEQIYSGTVGDWDEAKKLEEGAYSVSAVYNNNGAVGFNCPVFEGKADFIIKGGEITPVQIPVKLMNAIVRMEFTNMFKNYYSFEKITVTSQGTAVDFAADETRGAFIQATTFKVEGTLTSQAQGTSTNKTFSKEYTAKPTQCYSLKFDASNIGGNSFDITFGDEPSETITFDDIDINE